MLDSLKRLMKNTVFRLSIVAALLFAASSLIVLVYIYYAMVISPLARVDDTLTAELDELSAIFDLKGADALNQIVFIRSIPKGASSSDHETFYVFEFVDQNGKPHGGGNLPRIGFFTKPEEIPFWRKIPGMDSRQVREFEYVVKIPKDKNASPTTRRARGMLKEFHKSKAKLFIAKDVENIMATAERVSRALMVSMAIAILLGLITGIFVSMRFAKRIAAINKLATDIRAGDLKRRAPRDYSGDELDVLAEHLNSMLDHIDRLMIAMRYAGDSIAHDLRSPLTRLRTRLEAASADIADETAKETLLQASNDAGELLRTFESVLRIARLEAGDKREMLVPLDPKPVLEDIAELYEPACEDAGLEFGLEISGKTRIRADRGLLSQAVSNLVENAIKYTPSGGRIILRLRRLRNGCTEISVLDTGPGIPEKDRDRVKERFVRLEESRTAVGSGLGLALVDAIADLHQAEFELSDGLEKGNNKRKKQADTMPGLKASLIFPKVRKN